MENISTSTLMEPNQSQLRQMVLENTKRIDKQEVDVLLGNETFVPSSHCACAISVMCA